MALRLRRLGFRVAGVFRVAVGQLRHRLGRTLALLVAIALATGSFVALTGAVETARLQVRGTVAVNFRSTYDLLVRPRSSYTELERAQGLVRPNYQSGIFGGISTAQVALIRGLPGVEVAAPVANIGYVPLNGAVVVSVRRYLSGAVEQLFRVQPVWTSDRDRSRFVGAPSYVYVSRNKAVVLPRVGYSRGDESYRTQPTYAEVVPGRRDPVPVCTNYGVDKSATLAETGRGDTPFGYRDRYASSGPGIDCYYTGTAGSGSGVDVPAGAGDPASLTTVIPVTFPVLLAAVDPTAEQALSGLDHAVVTGRALTTGDRVARGSDGNPLIPVLAAVSTDVDQQVTAMVQRVSAPAGAGLSSVLAGQRGVVARVAGLPGTTVARLGPVPASRTYLDALGHPSVVQSFWTVGASTYDPSGVGQLGVRVVRNRDSVYASTEAGLGAPVGSDDTAVRAVTGHPLRPNQRTYAGLNVVGQFDPAKVLGEGALSGLTSETYVSPALLGANQGSRRALGGRSLAPSSNLGGYPAQPPTLLTTLAGAAPLLSADRFRGTSAVAPISVVRIRVAGINGADSLSRERLNQVALAISARTGLAVDIVAGASGVPTTVVLPAGTHGRPQLALAENWARKGVAYQVIDAVDRKSLTLFALILAVCALVVSTAASAAVRTRRTELGVMSCLGWPAGRLFGAVEIELAMIGLAAGLVGTGTALAAAHQLHTPIPLARAALAIPAAVLLAALAGLPPAFRAARATPMDAVQPQVVVAARARTIRSLAGMSGQSLRRVPGRTLTGAASLAVAVAAATFMLAVQHLFRGVVVGSLLGDAVTVQVRAPDLIALVAIVVLGAAGVADVLYLAAQEQAAELAVLRAIGWTDAALTRVILGQGAGIGALGALTGALTGGAAVATFSGSLPEGLVPLCAVCATAGIGVAIAASLVPALLIRRLPVTALIAQDAG